MDGVYIAISEDDGYAYHAACPEDLLELIMNDRGEINSSWSFYEIKKSDELKLTLG